MSIEDFFNDIKKGGKKNSELNQLYKRPITETGINMPTNQVFHKNIYYQADILVMPEDDKFKYILVVVDLYDGTMDAQELRNKSQDDIIKGFEEIFKRKKLIFPHWITFDMGSEFGKKTELFFTNHNTNVKYAETGRHRQVANVERANQKIVNVLFKRMSNQELITGHDNKNWVKDLHPLINVLNKNTKKPLEKEISDLPLVDEYNGELFSIGQKVRVILDYPISTGSEKRLNGTFRTSDIRWSKEIYEITEVLLKPGFPPAYLTSKNDNVSRTKNQLSKVRKNEKEPDAIYNRGETSEYGYITKIIGKERGNDNKLYYIVKMKGHNQHQKVSAKDMDRNKTLKEMKRVYNTING